MSFHFHMEEELLKLQRELRKKSYKPGQYRHFKIYDPKERTISVAPFRDRVVHHSIINIIEPIYEKTFIYDSYATRKDKGTHKAILRTQAFLRNNKWFLKADIKKYFESVDHALLIEIVKRRIKDKDTIELLEAIIRNGGKEDKGLPIGNLTSQFLANVFLDPFDHCIKEQLMVKCYVRYMDDFVILSDDKGFLKDIRLGIDDYLTNHLGLKLNTNVVMINQRANGLSFLGSRIYPNLLRIKKESLKRCMGKMQQKIKEWESGHIPEQHLLMSLNSINGYLSFFDSYMLRRKIFWGKG